MITNDDVIRKIAEQLARTIEASIETGGMAVELDFSRLPKRMRLEIPQPVQYVEFEQPAQIDAEWFAANVVPGLYGYLMNDPEFRSGKQKICTCCGKIHKANANNHDSAERR